MVIRLGNQVIFKNQGISFGILPNFGLILVLLVLASLILFFAKSKQLIRDRLILTGFAMLLGGGFSNLIDRFRLGYVIDFISIWIWPSFNVADCAIVIGVGIMVTRMIYAAKR